MDTPSARMTAEQAWRTLNVLWFPMLAFNLVYIFIPEFLAPPVDLLREEPEMREGLLYTFYAAAVALFTVATVLRRSRLARVDTVASGGRAASMPAAAGTQKYMSVVLVNLALLEHIAVLGLLAYLLLGEREALYGLTVASVLAMLMHRPKREEFDRFARHRHR